MIATVPTSAPSAGEVIRRHSRSFSIAAKFLPREVRGDVEKLYAWCRSCDDAVDEAVDPQAAHAALSELEADVHRLYAGERFEHAASRWLGEVTKKHRIEKRLPLDLIEGMRMDLSDGQLQDEEQLMRYCYHAAGVVGVMLCRIFGVTDSRAGKHAISLGIAMQLTNIARDVLEDWERRRCYLPASWHRFPLDTPPNQVAIRRCVARLLTLADHHYRQAHVGLKYLPDGVRPAIRAALELYSEIGREITRRDCEVLAGRITVPRSRFFTSLAGALGGELLFRVRAVRSTVIDVVRHSFSFSPEIDMRDTKYLIYLGVSLTAFMGSASFLLVAVNPKDEAYSLLPMVYAVVSLFVGIAANLRCRQLESDASDPISSNHSS